MMDVELNAWLLLDRLPRHFATTEIVTRQADGSTHRTTYAEVSARAQQLMHGLDALGLERGDRVGTFAWNTSRHLEAYLGIPASERVLHTLNIRLAPSELAYIIGHADDRAILADPDLLPALEQVHEEGGLSNVKHVIVLGSDVPSSSVLPGLIALEDLIADQPTSYERRDIDERTPFGICYTSGTTGRPKGAEYDHRAMLLHALTVSSGAAVSLGPGDTVLPFVPMFHAFSWGFPYTATLVGAKQVFYAGALDPTAVADLLAAEAVTVAAGVPTIWIEAAEAIAARGGLPHLRHIAVGGAQPPRALIERYAREFGIPIMQAWGMTETGPLASIAWPKAELRDLPEHELMDRVRSQAGMVLPMIEVTIRDDAGTDVPWDGESMGDLLVRGPWVIDQYLHGDNPEQFTDDGWFRTGDVAIGSPDGYFVIADRTKDLIKSGGEWISSVDMEGAIMAMDGVAEAAVVAIPDPKWQERPLACIVPAPGATITLEAVREHLIARGFAKWQLPDRIELIDEVPRTSVGKFDKKVLRARFSDTHG